MAYLFKTSSMAWLEAALSQKNKIGLHVLSTDGTTFRSQDTPENRAAFGFISKKNLVYPQLRMVGLMSTHSRMMLGAAFDSCSVGEETLAKNYYMISPTKASHYLTDVIFQPIYYLAGRIVERILIEMPVSPQARAKNPTLPATCKLV